MTNINELMEYKEYLKNGVKSCEKMPNFDESHKLTPCYYIRRTYKDVSLALFLIDKIKVGFDKTVRDINNLDN